MQTRRPRLEMDQDNVVTEQYPTHLLALTKNFAGRINTKDYDPTKTLQIHRRNRAYVWNNDMQVNCLDSILKGYYIPPIICSSRIENDVEIRYVMEGGNRITTFQRILKRQVRDLTDSEYMKVCMHPITQVVMKNLTRKQERELFRRLNKSIMVSDGQLYAMSEEDSPLVKEAMAFLNDTQYPLRERITELFYDTVGKDNNGRSKLANAVAIVSGALYGVHYITKSFTRQEDKIDDQSPIDRSKMISVLTPVFDIFEAANEEFTLISKTKKKGQLTVGKYIGPMLYDCLTCETIISDVVKKWTDYLVMARKGVKNADDAIEISGAKNINPDNLKRLSYKVDIFLKENRLASKEEIARIKHVHSNAIGCDDAGEHDDAEEDEDSDED